MLNNKISVSQFGILIVFFTIGSTVLVIPSSLAATSKQDAWNGVIVGLGVSLPLIWLFTKLWSMFPDITFVGICEKVLGSFFGRIVAVLFIFYSFVGSTTVLYYIGDFLTTEIMPDTPIVFINALFAMVIVMGVRLGIEVLARSAEILFPWFILLFIVFAIAITPKMQIENLQPIFQSGIKPLLSNAITYVGTATLPILSFFMVFPYINNGKKARRVLYVAAMIGGLFVAALTLFCIATLGTGLTIRTIYPSYLLAKKINIENFLTRIEAIMAVLWFFTMYFKISFYFYGFVTSISELVRLRDYRCICWPLGMILVVFSVIVYPSDIYKQDWDKKVFEPYVISMGLFIPLLLLGVSLLLKQRKSNSK